MPIDKRKEIHLSYHEVGDVFIFNGIKLRVKDRVKYGCPQCFFFDNASNRCLNIYELCVSYFRWDEKNVFFVKVETN